MSWTNNVLEILEHSKGSNAFTAEDAIEILKKHDYSKDRIYKALQLLTDEGFIIRISRGIYGFPNGDFDKYHVNSSVTSLQGMTKTNQLLDAEKILKNYGIKYMATGPSLLVNYFHHLPRRVMILLYVMLGSGEYAKKVLKENNFNVVLNPKINELLSLMDIYDDEDIFILREFSSLNGNIDGTASLEKAMLDTYFESTRNKIPLSQREVGRIISNIFRNENVNIKKLITLASRRGIKQEIIIIIKSIYPNIPINNDVYNYNNKIEAVLKGLRE